MIEVNDLHKKFGKVKVLNGIHLEYHPGKIYGLVGENGAGKTTLENCEVVICMSHLGIRSANPEGASDTNILIYYTSTYFLI